MKPPLLLSLCLVHKQRWAIVCTEFSPGPCAVRSVFLCCYNIPRPLFLGRAMLVVHHPLAMPANAPVALVAFHWQGPSLNLGNNLFSGPREDLGNFISAALGTRWTEQRETSLVWDEQIKLPCVLLHPGESTEKQFPALAADWQLWVVGLSLGRPLPHPIFAPWSVQSGTTSNLTAAYAGAERLPALGLKFQHLC